MLSCSPEAQQLLASWAPYLALVDLQPPQLRYPEQLAGDASPAATPTAAQGLVQQQQQQLAVASESPRCSNSGSAGSSPDKQLSADLWRSSSGGGSSGGGSSGGGSSGGGSSGGGSSGACSPCHRRCSSSGSVQQQWQQQFGFGSPISVAASPGTSPVAGISSRGLGLDRKDALAALVSSARAHIGKQPLLISHLARQTGLLHLLCKEVLSAADSSLQSEGGAGVEHVSVVGSCCGRAGLFGAAGQPTLGSRAAAAAEARARQDRLLQVSQTTCRQMHSHSMQGTLLQLQVSHAWWAEFSATVAVDHCSSSVASQHLHCTKQHAAVHAFSLRM
jgi:hypothetical protein